MRADRPTRNLALQVTRGAVFENAAGELQWVISVSSFGRVFAESDTGVRSTHGCATEFAEWLLERGFAYVGDQDQQGGQ